MQRNALKTNKIYVDMVFKRLELLTHFLCEYCDFVVWSKKGGTLVERVSADINFFDNIAGDLQHFFVYDILPEIVGKRYTGQPVSNKENIVPNPHITDKNDMNYDDDEDYEKT